MSFVLPGKEDGDVLSWDVPVRTWRADQKINVIDGFYTPSRDISMATESTNQQLWSCQFGGIKLPNGVVYLYTYLYSNQYGTANATAVIAPGFIPIGFRINANSTRTVRLSNNQTMNLQFQTTGAVMFYRPTGSSNTYVSYSGGIWYRTNQ